jgi:hypothetical protein
VRPISGPTVTVIDYKHAQRRLNWLGFGPLKVDGIYGPKSRDAVRRFKVSIGFRNSDYLGPLTWARLIADPPAPDAAIEPPWITEVRALMGRHERIDNALLRKWLASDGHALGDPAEFPWCGDLVETAIRLTLPNEPFNGPLGENPYWARNWLHFGERSEPLLGAVFVFAREGGGGHVGFGAGEGDGVWYIRSGNQSNRVTIAPIAKSRCLGIRRPVTWNAPLPRLPRMSGGTVSTNEA